MLLAFARSKEGGNQTMTRPEVTGRRLDDDLDGYSVSEFCRRWGFSPQTYYKLKKDGLMPESFSLGARVIISKEAIRRWVRDCEARERAKIAATALMQNAQGANA
jgi:predicted DNA-binding transcriptional regulator AlpA